MKPSNLLQTAVGYFALLNILVDILEEMEELKRYDMLSYQKYLKKAKNINVKNLNRYPLTSKSRSILYYDISLKIWPPKNESDERKLKLKNLLK